MDFLQHKLDTFRRRGILKYSKDPGKRNDPPTRVKLNYEKLAYLLGTNASTLYKMMHQKPLISVRQPIIDNFQRELNDILITAEAEDPYSSFNSIDCPELFLNKHHKYRFLCYNGKAMYPKWVAFTDGEIPWTGESTWLRLKADYINEPIDHRKEMLISQSPDYQNPRYDYGEDASFLCLPPFVDSPEMNGTVKFSTYMSLVMQTPDGWIPINFGDPPSARDYRKPPTERHRWMY